MDRLKQNSYDLAGTAAVVGGVLFTVGVGLRSSLSSDDAVHWLSWISLFLIGASSVICMLNAMKEEGQKKKMMMLLTWALFGVVSIWIAVDSIMDHDAHDFGAACKGNDETILKGPAIMEIGSAGTPALDSIAAVAFTIAIGSALFGQTTYESEGDAKTVDTMSRFLSTLMFFIAAIFTIKYAADTDNHNPFDQNVCGSATHREDIENDRKVAYGVIAAGAALICVSGTIRFVGMDRGEFGKDMIDILHTVLSAIFVVLILIGAFWECINTDHFADHSGGGFCQYTCDSAVGVPDGWNIKPTMSNAFFSLILPFSLSMAWRAYRPEKENEQNSQGFGSGQI